MQFHRFSSRFSSTDASLAAMHWKRISNVISSFLNFVRPRKRCRVPLCSRNFPRILRRDSVKRISRRIFHSRRSRSAVTCTQREQLKLLRNAANLTICAACNKSSRSNKTKTTFITFGDTFTCKYRTQKGTWHNS